MRRKALPLFELALVLVRLDHVAGIVRSEGSFKSCSSIHEFVNPLILIVLGSQNFVHPILRFLRFFLQLPKDVHLFGGSLARVGIEFAVEMFLKRGKRPSVVSGFQLVKQARVCLRTNPFID